MYNKPGINHEIADDTVDRRGFLKTGLALGATAAAAAGVLPGHAAAAENSYADPAEPALPPSNMVLDPSRAALVVVDPQIDFLSPDGVTWGVVGASVQEHNTVENLERLFKAAKQVDLTVAVSPHYYYPTDKGWRFEGALEKLMHAIGMFDRESPFELTENSGADFMPQYKPYILDGKTIITSPHKVYGPEVNDLSLQLRKHGVDQVAVVRDATAAAKIPEGDGYLAAIINFRYIANALWTTDEAVKLITA